MDANQERFIRVSIGLLARQLRSTVSCVRGVNMVLQDSKSLTVGQIELLNDVAKELLELEASVSSLAQAFPPEEPGSETVNRLDERRSRITRDSGLAFRQTLLGVG